METSEAGRTWLKNRHFRTDSRPPDGPLRHSCEGRNLYGVPVSDKPLITHQSVFMIVPVSDLRLYAHRIFI
ncbi:MAG: hypothetical protein IKR30_01520 [Bacteroidales bacterium]|nr:hypothetical protein [Bacteroidales bacterium]